MNVDESGSIIGSIAATLHGQLSDIIEVLNKRNRKIGEISFEEYMRKREKGKIW